MTRPEPVLDDASLARRPRAAAAPAWTGHRGGTREYRRVLVALLCGGLATFAQLYAPQGVLPRIAEDLAMSASQAALLISAATIGLAAGVIPWASIADRIGRVRAMKVSLALATACGFAVVACPSFHAILALRALEGFALGGLPAVAITYLHEEIDRSHVAVAAALFVSGSSVGGLLGRVVAAPLAQPFGWRIAVCAVAAIGALATIGFFVAMPPARGFDRSGENRLPIGRALVANLARREMVVLFVQGMLLMGGFVAVYNYLTFHLEAPPFSLDPTRISLLLFAYLAGTLSSGWAGKLAGRHGRIRVLCAAIAVMVIGALMLLWPTLPTFVVGLVVFTAGFFAAHAIASGWVGYRARAGKSQAASLYNLFYYCGSSFFGWFCGVVFVDLGWTAMVLLVAAMAIGAAALGVVQWRARPNEA